MAAKTVLRNRVYAMDTHHAGTKISSLQLATNLFEQKYFQLSVHCQSIGWRIVSQLYFNFSLDI